MSDKELEIFELCEELAKRLGEKGAIADLKTLRNLHPEMFKNMQEVANLIQEVVTEPEIIIKNPKPMSEKAYLAAKELNNNKMGEVGVRRDDNINKIFHANEKNAKKMRQLEKKEVVYKRSMVGTPTSYTQAQSLDERLVENSISLTANGIIPQNDNQSPHIQNKHKESQIKFMQGAVKKASLKLGLGENSKNNTSIELGKSQNINFNKGER